MVFIRDKEYPLENTKWNSYFEEYPYELSSFQKYAIEAILEGNHALVTAPTGSGKTLPAEFAIRYFTEEKKKRVIYTSPIKALSNQKFYEFTRKFPSISFGLLTGDIKTNPNADVLIMTTEILMNYLFSVATATASTTSSDTKPTNTSFQMDIESELGCVIFDEVHYINDAHRGQNWEQTILLLPEYVSMVMLSATIDRPDKFAKWCEDRYPESAKKVVLSYTNVRIVPLTHYGFLASNEIVYKKVKDKEIERKIREKTNSLIPLQSATGKFNETNYTEIANTLKIFENKQVYVNRKHVLNSLATHMRENELLPAIVFVFSRKNVELFANDMTTNLLEDDSKIPYIVARECEQILRSKLPNYKEYLELPEYIQLVKLLEKGVGIHHSGMIPILREIVEILISKSYIKMLFATESFAIGLDCPIRTAVFTSLTKFDGEHDRYLLPHEYTQMAGRAGRRGIDTIGNCIHCNNLYTIPFMTDYKMVLSGKPQNFISKMRVSYQLLLALMKNGRVCNFDDFMKKSMIYDELLMEIGNQRDLVQEKSALLSRMKDVNIPFELCKKYIDLEDSLSMATNKKRKEIQRQIDILTEENKGLSEKIKTMRKIMDLEKELEKENKQLKYLEDYLLSNIEKVGSIMEERGFITIDNVAMDTELMSKEYRLTERGKMATMMAEIHPLLVVEMMEEIEKLTTIEIICLLSSFTDIKVPEDKRKSRFTLKEKWKSWFEKMTDIAKWYEQRETELGVYIGYDYANHVYDLVEEMEEWCNAGDEHACRYFVQTVLQEKQISLGDFSKAVLKISTITKELMNVCEMRQNVELLHKLAQIDELMLKYITTNQSLYV